MKRVVVAGLVKLYPSRWRAEYGEELADVLMRRPLGLGAVLNVAANAGWQQLRTQEPWLLMGIPLLILSSWYWLSVFTGVTPWILGGDAARDSWAGPAIFGMVGLWTRLRSGRGAGRAAMKVSVIATLPFLLVGLLALFGFTRTTVAANAQWPFACCRLGSVSSDRDAILALLVMPILQIPFVGLIGWLGGQAGRLARS